LGASLVKYDKGPKGNVGGAGVTSQTKIEGPYRNLGGYGAGGVGGLVRPPEKYNLGVLGPSLSGTQERLIECGGNEGKMKG
jgi:hypothetical protein